MVAVQRNLSKFGIREIARTGKVKKPRKIILFSFVLFFKQVDVCRLN